jgi:hypothetical protein
LQSELETGALVAEIGQTLLNAIADLKAAMERQFTAVDARLAALTPMHAQLDGLPLISRAVTVVQQDVRALRAAFKDFALTNTTAGEIEALSSNLEGAERWYTAPTAKPEASKS